MESLQNVGQVTPMIAASSAHSNLLPCSRSSFTPVSTPYLQQRYRHHHAAAKVAASDLHLRASSSFNGIKGEKDIDESCSSSAAARQSKGTTRIFMRSNAAAGYAAALAELGQSKRVLHLIHDDLKKLGTLLQQTTQVRNFLLHPSIEATHKKRILGRLAEEASFVPYTLRMLNLVVEKKGGGMLQDLVKEFMSIYRQIASTDVALVLSATQLDDAQLARVLHNIPHGMPSPMTGYIVDYGYR
ncbi:hypothetical protein KP509_25G045600 [Ceratopteris richardii]|uniref:Uncharacterized protein n=1 Tax=Ceratopteris richardii TaxID=49495 RepID=A0A8T2RPQ9_CERRI|nr:hypothetical protein KP509_25G045600 [Ceratopteris richardii]